MSTTRRRSSVTGKLCADADVNQPRFLAPGNDFNRKAQRGFRFFQERVCIFRHAQRIGAEGAHVARLKTAQTLTETLQAIDGARLRCVIEVFVFIKPGAETHRLAQSVERISLLAIHARNLAMERIGSQINSSNRGVFGHVN
jgi:hypothetical protein